MVPGKLAWLSTPFRYEIFTPAVLVMAASTWPITTSPTFRVLATTAGRTDTSLFERSFSTRPGCVALTESPCSYAFIPGRNSSGDARKSPGRTTATALLFFSPVSLLLISIHLPSSPRNLADCELDPLRPVQEILHLPAL